MEERLRKDYKWLFEKKEMFLEGTKRKFRKKELTPTIVDGGSHWQVYREKDASPLILSKNYGMV